MENWHVSYESIMKMPSSRRRLFAEKKLELNEQFIREQQQIAHRLRYRGRK